ncbi:TetR/AcrR family transcriptional regulator [uncultured Amnibacterium sp.]|uniref:TetR/AcrR family transcriptional regulator n=1 Tax=uncultured Amnibacterium sp. TaxID=1631851 RepID=UPI0035CB908A
MPASSADALRQAALAHFATHGFEGASLHRIAETAGLSKSIVLYHFASKEALLEAALRPAVDDLRDLVGLVQARSTWAPPSWAQPSRAQLLDAFVQFLFTHRLAAATLVYSGRAIPAVPIVAEADALIRRLATSLAPAHADDLDALRFGIALAGATFALLSADRWSTASMSEHDLRIAMTQVLAGLVFGSESAPTPEPVP